MLSIKKQIITWIACLFLYPTIIILSYSLNSLPVFTEPVFYIYILLGIIVSYFPLNIKGSTLFLTSAVGIAMFVSYGLFSEMLLTSVAVLVVMIKIGITKQDAFRVPLNLLLFQIVSLSSGTMYYILDPILPSSLNLKFNLLSLTTYLLFSLLMNRILIYLLDIYWYNLPKSKLIDFEFLFSMISFFYAIPIAALLIYLGSNYSYLGIIIASLPLITLTIIFKFYFVSKSQNKYLSEINNLAMELTGKYSQRDVIEEYLKSWAKIFSAQTISYYETTRDLQLIELYRYNVATKTVEKLKSNYILCPSIVEESWLKNEIVCFNNSTEFTQEIKSNNIVESMLILPVKRSNKVIGFIVMMDSKRNAYKNNHLISAITVLQNYLNVALENAYNFERLQSNSRTDHLTGLTNLRAFESDLIKFNRQNPNERFTIIIIDLDHFKRVNDTFGHQAGNELLKQFSILMNTFVYEEEHLARYGGEEFIFFIPRKSVAETLVLAEEIRQKIEETAFNTHNYLANRELVKVNMTASVGLATYPDHCSSFNELITLADRAMYIGSKQRGRNRVSSIIEGEEHDAEKSLEPNVSF